MSAIIHLRAKKNAALSLITNVFDAEWQPSGEAATGFDTYVSKDKGSPAECTNEFTAIGATNIYSLDLTADEMNADVVYVRPTVTNDGIKVPAFLIHTYSEPLDIANTELAAVPNTAGSLRAMVQFIFSYLRNKRTSTRTGTDTLYKEDGSTALGQATFSDDGDTFTQGEMN